MESVRLEGIKKIYDNEFVAVHDANIDVEEGEFLVLVGPSGCGKSTLLRMIAGLESITEGSLYIDGTRVNDVAPKDRDIAMVFQNYALYPHLTVFENMAFGLRLRKHPRGEIQETVMQAAGILGLEDILDKKPKTLSGGQRQRVAVGRAIVRDPTVFLFDEPLSNLDAKLRVQMRAEIRGLHQRLGATMIYVTHDQVEAMTMGDRIVVMRAGVVEQIDTPINLYDRPANRFVAGFIGSPSMNFVEGSFIQNGDPVFRERDQGMELSLSPEQAGLLAGHDSEAVTLGIRPEDIFVKGSRMPEGVFPEAVLEVGLVEQMGCELMLHVRTRSSDLVARVDRQSLPQPGSAVGLAFSQARLHFFDGESGTAIT
jgi:multiple sugar transport system ATP-binding protein